AFPVVPDGVSAEDGMERERELARVRAQEQERQEREREAARMERERERSERALADERERQRERRNKELQKGKPKKGRSTGRRRGDRGSANPLHTTTHSMFENEDPRIRTLEKQLRQYQKENKQLKRE
ncbi:hypothetical protein KIPB_015106, partial [Kipferlia bialata]